MILSKDRGVVLVDGSKRAVERIHVAPSRLILVEKGNAAGGLFVAACGDLGAGRSAKQEELASGKPAFFKRRAA